MSKRNKKPASETVETVENVVENAPEETVTEMAVVAEEFEPLNDESDIPEPTEAEIAELATDTVAEVSDEPVTEPTSEGIPPFAEPTTEAPVSEPVTNTQQAVLAAIDQRIYAAEDAGNAGLAAKWGDERAYFVQAAYIAQIDLHKLNVAALGNLAIYAAQKYRKVLTAVISESKAKVDGYTRCTLNNAKVLEAEEVPFTYELHNAALSKSSVAERSAKLAMRLSSNPSTASTQSSSTRQALSALGVLRLFKTMDGKNAFAIDWESPIVQAIA